MNNVKKFFKAVYSVIAGVLGGMFVMMIIVLACAWATHLIVPDISIEDLETAENAVWIVGVCGGIVGGLYVGFTWYE